MINTKAWKKKDIQNLNGKIVIVTGANSGTGYEITKVSAEKGAHVIMGCRSIERGETAKTKILKDFPEAQLTVLQLDLSDLASIKTFVEDFKQKFDRLDQLHNNAGVMQTPERKTDDGFELQLGTNHLGHFALTGQLLDHLKNTEASRVITVSSAAHSYGSMDFENLQYEKSGSYGATKAYGRSKLANLLFAYELQRKFEQAGIATKSLAAHPGYSRTKLQSAGLKLGGGIRSKIWRGSYKLSNVLVAQSAARGAEPMLMAGTIDGVNGGEYFGPRLMGWRGHPKIQNSNKLSNDQEVAQKLWEVSEELTGISYDLRSS